GPARPGTALTRTVDPARADTTARTTTGTRLRERTNAILVLLSPRNRREPVRPRTTGFYARDSGRLLGRGPRACPAHASTRAARRRGVWGNYFGRRCRAAADTRSAISGNSTC